jgi:hypothetical protein
MNYTETLRVGTPVVCRSYVSGVIVGRLHSGEAGVVALTHWRWLRRWEGVGGEGSVYDLVTSDKTWSQAGPYAVEVTILQQADVMVISEEAYARLAQPAADAVSGDPR